MKFLYLMLACLLAYPALSQNNVKLSDPIPLPQSGWNKLLIMKNGNTVLLHVEPEQPIAIIVFDTAGKLIATKTTSSKYLDAAKWKQTIIEGFFEVNSEAVLFADQEVYGKHCLVRLQFSAADGKLTAEELAVQSSGTLKRTHFFVAKDAGGEGYSVFCSRDVLRHNDENLELVRYNKTHGKIRSTPINLDRKAYDYFDCLGIKILPQGTFIGLCTKKVIGAPVNKLEKLDHFVSIYFVPADTEMVMNRTINVTKDVFPNSFNVTYNPFAHTFNFLVFSFSNLNIKDALTYKPEDFISSFLLVLDETSLAAHYNWVTNTSATKLLRDANDSTHTYIGMPLQMFTNENGLTTIFSQEYSRGWDNLNSKRRGYYTYLGKIGIAQLNDEGKEISGNVLPRQQVMTSYSQYTFPGQLPGVGQPFNLLPDLPEADYQKQFGSTNCYAANKSFYMIYNDNFKNMGSTLGKPVDSVYDFTLTDAVVEKMDRHGALSKTYLLGQPGIDESKSSFIQSGVFDDKKAVYTTLVLCRKGKEMTTNIAWCHLD